MRKKRKLDHLNLVQNLSDGPDSPGFKDVLFVHNCMPEIDHREINTAVKFCGREMKSPLMINAITGGIGEAAKINRALAAVARKLGIPMAVGSQTAALQDRKAEYSYKVAREENPDGFIAANVSAGLSPEEALRAVEMIGADALQLHLNIPQEVMMPEDEGELSFQGYLDNIRNTVLISDVPVIVKEVGCGIAREQAVQIISTGVAALDVGGKGGTNFILIEGFRRSGETAHPFLNWGLSTVSSLVEVVYSAGSQVDIVAAGGIRNGLDVAKALSLGASLAGIAGPLVRCYYNGGEEAVEHYLLEIEKQLRQVMLMLGARSVSGLREKPLVILGETAQWLKRRGIDLDRFACRGRLT
ncbi:MAG: type 2 isopentenyl-diphosphate Delta-isomerase [Dethiobacteria bacterium]